MVSALGGSASASFGTTGGAALAGSSQLATRRSGRNGPLWCTTDSSKRPPPLWTLAAEDRVPAASSRAPASVEADDDVFAEECSELQSLWKGTNVNRFFEPIDKIPRFSGPAPDPRKIFGDKEPTCYTGWGERRQMQIIRRWDSLPQLPGQLKPEFLGSIADYKERWRSSRVVESAAEAAIRRGRERRAKAGAAAEQQIRENVQSPTKRNGPFIECSCCEHEKPKPWLQQKSAGAAALAFLDEVAGEGPSRTAKATGGPSQAELCTVCGGTPIGAGRVAKTGSGGV